MNRRSVFRVLGLGAVASALPAVKVYEGTYEPPDTRTIRIEGALVGTDVDTLARGIAWIIRRSRTDA